MRVWRRAGSTRSIDLVVVESLEQISRERTSINAGNDRPRSDSASAKETSIYGNCLCQHTSLLSPSTSSNVLVVLMAAEAEVVTNGVNGTNGAKANGKVKSKNQLRRLKAKQKKAEQTQTPVRV